jgi:hypothetical protein
MARQTKPRNWIDGISKSYCRFRQPRRLAGNGRAHRLLPDAVHRKAGTGRSRGGIANRLPNRVAGGERLRFAGPDRRWAGSTSAPMPISSDW